MKLLRGFPTELKLAARRLSATPLFTIFAVLSLAIGVAVTTVVYSIVDSMFFRGPGVRDPARLAFFVTPADGRVLNAELSYPDFLDVRGAQRSFSSISASEPLFPPVGSGAATEVLPVEAVDGAYFLTFGITAAIGRTIEPRDNPGTRVAVLSDWMWRARFARDPNIVGRTLRLAGQSFEIIGVAAPQFEGFRRFPATRLWIPLTAEASRDARRLLVFGRLTPSSTEESATAELEAIGNTLNAAFPSLADKGGGGQSYRRWRARSLATIASEDDGTYRFGLMLVVIVGLVLMVACTNLANLVLARGTIRQQEFTVRSALGAPRWRLVREQCAESLLLAIAGFAASYGAFEVLRALMTTEFSFPMPMGGLLTVSINPALNASAVSAAAVCVLLSLVVFGLEPALQLTRTADLRGALAESGGNVGTPRVKRQRLLVRWQVAISAGFFIIATMFVRYTVAEARHDSGVEIDRLAIAVVNFRAQQWDEARVRRALERVQSEIDREPAIESAAFANGLPFGMQSLRLAVSTPESALTRTAPTATGIAATPSIFKTLGIPLLHGRGFDDHDALSGASVVVLSEFTARTILGTSDAVGRLVTVRRQGSPAVTATVIGVAGNTDVGRLFGEARALVYLPATLASEPLIAVAARSAGRPTIAARALSDALRRADPELAIDLVGTGRTVLAAPYVLLRAAGVTALALGGLTLLLSMVGLFGIQSHAVLHRTREIGLRMSIGATTAQIRRMVLTDGYRPVRDGLILGLFGGLAGRVIVRAYLDIDVDILDPWMAVVPLPLVVAAFCACYLPARRAATVDPHVALRRG
jgi:predicted permease